MRSEIGEAKKLEAIQKLLKQRDEIDKQLTELGYREIASPTPPTPSEMEPAARGKRTLPEDTRLLMSAQYWIRHGAENPAGYKAAITPVKRDTPTKKKDSSEAVAQKAALREMIRNLRKKGSNGYSPRNKLMRQGS